MSRDCALSSLHSTYSTSGAEHLGSDPVCSLDLGPVKLRKTRSEGVASKQGQFPLNSVFGSLLLQCQGSRAQAQLSCVPLQPNCLQPPQISDMVQCKQKCFAPQQKTVPALHRPCYCFAVSYLTLFAALSELAFSPNTRGLVCSRVVSSAHGAIFQSLRKRVVRQVRRAQQGSDPLRIQFSHISCACTISYFTLTRTTRT